jgi:hypothetical protein
VISYVKFEVFTAVTSRNAAFFDVTPCDSRKNRRFGATYCFNHHDEKNHGVRNNVRSVPPKRQFLGEPHGIKSQKTE